MRLLRVKCWMFPRTPITSLSNLVQHLNSFSILADKHRHLMENLFFYMVWYCRASFSNVLHLQPQWMAGNQGSFPPCFSAIRAMCSCLLMDKPYTRVAEVQTMSHFTSFLLIESSVHRQTRPVIDLSFCKVQFCMLSVIIWKDFQPCYF